MSTALPLLVISSCAIAIDEGPLDEGRPPRGLGEAARTDLGHRRRRRRGARGGREEGGVPKDYTKPQQ